VPKAAGVEVDEVAMADRPCDESQEAVAALRPQAGDLTRGMADRASICAKRTRPALRRARTGQYRTMRADNPKLRYLKGELCDPGDEGTGDEKGGGEWEVMS
jgi:hypothetical protein